MLILWGRAAMIDPTRRELLNPIEELSAACPEYRFGQPVLNLAFMAREDEDRQVGTSRMRSSSRRHASIRPTGTTVAANLMMHRG